MIVCTECDGRGCWVTRDDRVLKCVDCHGEGSIPNPCQWCDEPLYEDEDVITGEADVRIHSACQAEADEEERFDARFPLVG